MDYKFLKKTLFTFCVVLISFQFFENSTLPVLSIPLTTDLIDFAYILFLAISLLTYGHLTTEKTSLNFEFEKKVTHFIFWIGVISYFVKDIQSNPTELVSSILLVGALGYLLTFLLDNLFRIRSKKKVEQLKLPRIPYAVKASLTFLPVALFIIFLVFVLIIRFFGKFEIIYQSILELSILFILVFISSSIKYFIYFLRLSGWKDIEAEFEQVNQIFDIHDRSHQNIGTIPIKMSYDEEYENLGRLIDKNSFEEMNNYLLDGNDPNKKFAHGWTAALLASAENKIFPLKALIEHGADLNINNASGLAALNFAANYNYIDIVKLLLENQANPNNSSRPGPSPLQVSVINGNYEIAKLLLAYKAKPDLTTASEQLTPLELAMKNGYGEIAKILRKN